MSEIGDIATHADFREAPLIETEPVAHCPVCGGQGHKPFAYGYDYELQTCQNRWVFVSCDHCGHVWLNPRPAVSTLGVIYPKTYYAYNYASEVNPVALKAKQLLDRRKISGILGRLARKPESYVDIGCGDGRFLHAMAGMGLERENIHGLELDEKVIAPLAQAGYKAYCRRVEDCTEIQENSIDLATMFHVIEHVDDPGAVIARVGAWLRPGGVFAVETPNLDSYDARKFHDTLWGGYHIPRHWNLFTPETLKRLMESRGLEVIGTRFQTGHSFWMYSYQHLYNYGPRPNRALAKRFNPFKGLPLLACFTGFDMLRATLGYRTSAMLMLARKR